MRSAGASRAFKPACRRPRTHGVLLALENHWGLTTKTENLLRIYKARRLAVAGDQPRHRQLSRSIPIPRSRSSRRTRRSSRPRPTTAAASGTRWISTTSASPASCARRISRAGSRSRWKARKIRPPPCRRASRCCARRLRVRPKAPRQLTISAIWRHAL